MSILLATVCLIGQQTSARSVSDLRCGGYCLFVALRANGLGPTTYDELEANLGLPGVEGYSIQQLSEAAQRYGAQTIAVKTSIETLQNRKEPFVCIAQIRQDHFAIINKIDSNYAHIIDHPKTYKLPIETLNSTWTKNALLIGTTSFQPEEKVFILSKFIWHFIISSILLLFMIGCLVAYLRKRSKLLPVATLFILISLVGCGRSSDKTPLTKVNSVTISPLNYDFGTIIKGEGGNLLETKVTIQNSSSSPLTITKLSLGCSCTTALLDHNPIPPNSQGTVQVKINGGDLTSERHSSLTINTDNKEFAETVVSFKWRVIMDLTVDPFMLDLGRVQPQEPITSLVAISSTYGMCKNCKVTVAGGSSGVSGKFLPNLNYELSDESHNFKASTHVIGQVELAINPGLEIKSELSGAHISLDCTSRRTSVSIPVSWQVSPALMVTPNRVSLGRRHPNEPASFSLKLTSTDHEQMNIIKCISTDEHMPMEFNVTKIDPVSVIIKISLTTPSKKGLFNCFISIDTTRSTRNSISVPVSILVE